MIWKKLGVLSAGKWGENKRSIIRLWPSGAREDIIHKKNFGGKLPAKHICRRKTFIAERSFFHPGHLLCNTQQKTICRVLIYACLCGCTTFSRGFSFFALSLSGKLLIIKFAGIFRGQRSDAHLCRSVERRSPSWEWVYDLFAVSIGFGLQCYEFICVTHNIV